MFYFKPRTWIEQGAPIGDKLSRLGFILVSRCRHAATLNMNSSYPPPSRLIAPPHMAHDALHAFNRARNFVVQGCYFINNSGGGKKTLDEGT